jgi:hypothetical protein
MLAHSVCFFVGSAHSVLRLLVHSVCFCVVRFFVVCVFVVCFFVGSRIQSSWRHISGASALLARLCLLCHGTTQLVPPAMACLI